MKKDSRKGCQADVTLGIISEWGNGLMHRYHYLLKGNYSKTYSNYKTCYEGLFWLEIYHSVISLT